ncbi:MAG TPA: GNAT family N-acetyltransferase [Candidatus Kapabacteria bacterium]|nr:GNAT family N-acetyltransferase [Candidatus Kapabacteria bacterium]
MKRYSSATEFLAETERFLLEAETRNNLILGIARSVDREAAEQRPPSAIEPCFAAVLHNGEPVLCGFRTRAERFGITGAKHTDALHLLARDAHAACPEARLMMGPEPDVALFAQAMADCRGGQTRRHRAQRLHELLTVKPRPLPPGCLRVANDADAALLTRWVAEFLVEVDESGDAAELAAARIRSGALFVWDDNGPVSMAAWTGKTPAGVRINFVYTPAELRGRGYASACVAALSAALLQEGNRSCCLYTDLANPISNAIYRRIGYEPICDWGVYALEGMMV